MKKALLLLLSTFALLTFSCQSKFVLNYWNGVVTEIEKIEDLDSEQLFEISQEWFNKNFNSSGAAVDFCDKDMGRIIGRNIAKTFSYQYSGHYYYSVLIDVKNEKARISLKYQSDASLDGDFGLTPKNPQFQEIVTNEFQEIAEEYFEFINERQKALAE